MANASETVRELIGVFSPVADYCVKNMLREMDMDPDLGTTLLSLGHCVLTGFAAVAGFSRRHPVWVLASSLTQAGATWATTSSSDLALAGSLPMYYLSGLGAFAPQIEQAREECVDELGRRRAGKLAYAFYLVEKACAIALLLAAFAEPRREQ